MVARLHRGDARADRFDDARRLVPQDAGEEALRVVPVQSVRIRVAQRGGDDLDADLALLGRGDNDVRDFQGLLGGPGDGGRAGDGLKKGRR